MSFHRIPESQTLMLLSREPETMVLPSDEKATDMISRLWAFCFSVFSSSVSAMVGKVELICHPKMEGGQKSEHLRPRL